jgi:hypothetical protein
MHNITLFLIFFNAYSNIYVFPVDFLKIMQVHLQIPG